MTLLNDEAVKEFADALAARALKTKDPARGVTILRQAATAARDAHGLGYADLYNELSDLLAANGLAEEALGYSRKAYDAARKK